MTTWIKYRADRGSWHVFVTLVRTPDPATNTVPQQARTLCGRIATGPTAGRLPSEKSCESCLRTVERSREAKA